MRKHILCATIAGLFLGVVACQQKSDNDADKMAPAAENNTVTQPAPEPTPVPEAMPAPEAAPAPEATPAPEAEQAPAAPDQNSMNQNEMPTNDNNSSTDTTNTQ